MFHRSVSSAEISIRLIEALDHIEKRIELMRQEAAALEQERICLEEMLNNILNNKDLGLVSEGEREEINVNAQRLLARCLTVDVQVSTPRNPRQEEALSRANQCINQVVCRDKSTDLPALKLLCQAFLNACLPEPNGSIDQRFQAIIIECAADDQKRIRKRLESLLRTIEHAEKRNTS